MMPPSDWSIALFGEEIIDVDWRLVGGDWDRLLSRAMFETAGFSVGPGAVGIANGVRSLLFYDPPPGHEFTVRLTIEPRMPRGVFVTAHGNGVQVDAELNVWRAAIRAATAGVNKSEKEFQWTAILRIGPDQTLVGRSEIGSMKLHSRPSAVSGGMSGAIYRPLYLDGSTVGYSWVADRVRARATAHEVAAILSVAWHTEIALEWEPLSSSQGDGAPGLVDQAWTLSDDRDLVMPDWIDAGWSRMADNLMLRTAILSHYEGLRLNSSQFPSAAYAMYIASIEAVGAMMVPLGEKCEKCKQRIGAMKRFRAALALVESPTSANYKRLKDNYSVFRSTTVHGGSLHGGEELSRGSWQSGNPFLVTDALVFNNVEQSLVHDTSQRILVQCLTARWPLVPPDRF